MNTSRRDFLKAGVAIGALPMATPVFADTPVKNAATEWVTLGKSSVKVTRLAFGTGTHSGAVQRKLGQEEFTRLVRYAYDNGIRFFETADSYHGMPQMLSVALKGLPRDSYRLMTKYNTHDVEDPMATINRLRTDLGADYVDIMLLHCVRSPNWPDQTKKLQDAFSEAKDKKIILSHGASVHGQPALKAFPGNQWLDIAMIRMNHKGAHMDTPETQDVDYPGDVPFVVSHMQQVKAQGAGIISMKLVGEGDFKNPDDRQKSINFAFRKAGVDSVTIGFGTTAEIDEAISRINSALA
ncbi:MAG TPA: aldo/keto reductase [Bryobacteraceae bacterium]|jgi:aryl-alcohol dehydrogenase-like predicted oxidoreductase|nr:aldo/keto reductase [Bryobacteraceae bacterium]